MSLSGLHRLKQPGCAHAGTNTHRHHAPLLLVAAHTMQQSRRANGSRCAQWVSQGNSTAQRIYFCRIKAQVFDHRQ